MRDSVPPLLFWAPRVLCIVLAIFLAVFALDVFRPGLPAGAVAIAFAMHLLPSFVLLLLLALFWRHEFLGAVTFVGLGIAYIGTTWGRFHWSAYAVISGSLFLLGGLFLANWFVRRRATGTARSVPQPPSCSD